MPHVLGILLETRLRGFWRLDLASDYYKLKLSR
jgi:hypothetical protein